MAARRAGLTLLPLTVLLATTSQAATLIRRANLGANAEQDSVGGGLGAVSDDGRFVVFQSTGTNLVPNDTDGAGDVFVRDRLLGTTELVLQGFSARISADGRYVAAAPGAPGFYFNEVLVYDRTTATTETVPTPLAHSFEFSADGRHVVFPSTDATLVPGDTNGFEDIFLYDLDTSVTTRVSVASGGAQSNHYSTLPAVSGDGRYVAFVSRASNLVGDDTNIWEDAFVHDTQRIRPSA